MPEKKEIKKAGKKLQKIDVVKKREKKAKRVIAVKCGGGEGVDLKLNLKNV